MDFVITIVLPIVALGTAGALVPVLSMRLMPNSLAGLGLAAVISIILLTIGGAILFVILYGSAGSGSARTPDQLQALHFLGLGARAALVWGPVLLLTLIALGQGVERRRGERMAARDRD